MELAKEEPAETEAPGSGPSYSKSRDAFGFRAFKDFAAWVGWTPVGLEWVLFGTSCVLAFDYCSPS